MKDAVLSGGWVPHEDLWSEAERLVIQQGWDYARVAEELRIPLSTLQKRAAAGKWQAKRREAISYQAQARRLKARVLEGALSAWETAKELDQQVKVVQLLHAWKSLELAFPEHRYPERAGEEEEKDPLAAMSDEQLMEIIARGKVPR